ncbi:MAG: sodium-dependent transporter [Planctomycetes bacterium]|nr:sodium-dependent transporter [Planctomycetota bacterium]
MSETRPQWGSRVGFILAAAGSAVGLGNIWKFPYITGENGGGWFVLIYLVCIAVIGLPIMMAEIFIGRTAQNSPVGAIRSLSRPGSPWIGVGWLGVLTAFVILSYYSVIAGWAMHYVFLSVEGGFAGLDKTQVDTIFAEFSADPMRSVFWHVLFMFITFAIVVGGVKRGVERSARILMPALCLMMVALVIHSIGSDGFKPALDFVFAPHNENFHWGPATLEALGHAFFTLSLGMGAMITYGSYLKRDDDLVTTSVTVCTLDTVIALLACMVIFPIIFTYGMEPDAGPGLVFKSLPLAFGKMAGGAIWATVFFLLLTFAALTSGISLLEVAASYFIDERGWSRFKASSICAAVILLMGVPTALSAGTKLFGSGFAQMTSIVFGENNGKDWFGVFDYISSNWMLPLGGLFISLFVAWRVSGEARERGFKSGTKFDRMFWGWVFLLRFIVPFGVIAVFLNLIGFFDLIGLTGE